MAQNAPNEVEEAIKQLKSKPGFHSFVLMNNDGIVIKYENMEYSKAVMYAYHILDLYTHSSLRIAKIKEADNGVECIRLRTNLNEMIIAQYSRFTLVVVQLAERGKAEPLADDVKEKEAEEKMAG